MKTSSFNMFVNDYLPSNLTTSMCMVHVNGIQQTVDMMKVNRVPFMKKFVSTILLALSMKNRKKEIVGEQTMQSSLVK